MMTAAQDSRTGNTGALPRRRPSWVWLLAALLLGLAVGVGARWLREVRDPTGGQEPQVTVNLAIEPADATVMVDGAIVGQGPQPTLELAEGLHSIRVEREGYLALVTPLRVETPGGMVALKLTPIEFAQLEVSSTPLGAQVFVDGDFRGVTPLKINRLQPGIHDLLVTKPNYTTHQARYTLRAGETRPVTDIALENTMLLMLKANLEIGPRSIGNHLDLAHFYYVNNEMTQAVKHYIRARELASLPMPPPLPGTPPEDIAFQQQLFQDEIRRVKTEEDHHYVNFREYYGNGLDFDTFRREYGRGVEGFNRWASGIQDLNWVMEQGLAAMAADHPWRAAELFSDFALRNAESGVALGCETAALLAAGKVAEARDCYPLALTALDKEHPSPAEARWRSTAWRLLGAAWHGYGMKAVGELQKTSLTDAGACLEKAVSVGEDRLDRARAELASSLLARDLRDAVKYTERLRAAYATIQGHADTMKGNPEVYAECAAVLWRVQYRVAFLELEAGDKAKATVLLRQIVQAADEKQTVVGFAKHALELLDSGKTPVLEEK